MTSWINLDGMTSLEIQCFYKALHYWWGTLLFLLHFFVAIFAWVIY